MSRVAGRPRRPPCFDCCQVRFLLLDGLEERQAPGGTRVDRKVVAGRHFKVAVLQ